MTTSTAGEHFGRYRLISELGRGGMGVVFLARDDQVGRMVALKVIGDDIAESDEFRARFAREMRIAVKLEHPNVVPVYETGQLDGRMFIAMRYVDGPDLGRVLRHDGPVEPNRLARLSLMLGSALDAAHAIGLVHRDVKPANVLLARVGPDQHVYLTDFGLAREALADRELTHTGQWMGTADYISPEQLDGQLVSARTDIYSMSCMLFHALTGAPPYPGTVVSKLKGHTLEPMPSIGTIHPHWREIDRVLQRGAHKRPQERYPSAGDLARAFSRAIAGENTAMEEREVATGAALSGISTRDDLPVAGIRPPKPGPSRTRVTEASPAETLGDFAAASQVPVVRGRPKRRRTLMVAGAALVVGAGLAAAVLLGGSQPRSSPAGRRQANGAARGAPASGPVGQISRSAFVLTVLGAHQYSVWYVEQGAPQWTATGIFTATGNPSIAEGDGKTVIAARGADAGTIWYTVAGVPGWTSTGPASLFTGASDPAASVSPTGQITIADRGTDNTVWYVQPRLRTWTSTGSFTASGDISIAEGHGKTVIAARSATDGSIWYTTLGATGWTSTGPATEFTGASDPAVSVSPTGQITIADRGTDNTVWYVQPGLRTWTSLGAFLAADDPEIVSP
jgi:predicted Ser/Thr protein kinase